MILVLHFQWAFLFRKCANPEDGNVLFVRVVYDCNNTQSVSSGFFSLRISKISAGSNGQTGVWGKCNINLSKAPSYSFCFSCVKEINLIQKTQDTEDTNCSAQTALYTQGQGKTSCFFKQRLFFLLYFLTCLWECPIMMWKKPGKAWEIWNGICETLCRNILVLLLSIYIIMVPLEKWESSRKMCSYLN